jgi:glycosyltransferase involved in cell wall biosynthesis
MKLAITGFVSGEAGSGASAHVLILRELLKNNHEIHFFSKPTFVDPRPLFEDYENFHFINVTNTGPDRFRQHIQNIPLIGLFGHKFDAGTYNRLLVKTIAKDHIKEKYDVCLWMGDFTRGKIAGLPTICCHAPVPGTDARSILKRYEEIKKMAGPIEALKWKMLAHLRLKLGLPQFNYADHLIMTGQWAKNTMNSLFGVNKDKMSILPLPIDLNLFNLPRVQIYDHEIVWIQRKDEPLKVTGYIKSKKKDDISKETIIKGKNEPLRICWVGRIVPRKRLDLFLDGAALAINKGANLQLTILGDIKLISGYEKLITNFPFQNRLTWIKSVGERKHMPKFYHTQDVLVQPSEEEDFGSSPAEAQACGLPVIVGNTSGNADCVCSNDIVLSDYHPETLCNAYIEMSNRKSKDSAVISRKCAERYYSVETITSSLIYRLENVKEEMGELEIFLKYHHLLPEFPL